MTTGEKLFIEGKFDEAYDVLMEEGAKGNGRALYLLGEYAKHTWLTPVDWELAKRYAEEGAAAGDVLADFNTAYAMPRGSEEQKAHLEALLPKVRALAEVGDALAMYEMADVCEYGICCEKSERGRWEWNEKCAAAGLWIARARMGSLYLWADRDMADFQDVEKGIALLETMISENRKSSGEAAQLLADHYMFTDKVLKSYRYSKIAAKWGHPLGYFFLGRHYMIGEIVKPNFSKAIELFEKCFASRCEVASEAAVYIGNAYSLSGEEKRAVSWYEKAEAMGNDRAMVELGICYHQGIGVRKSDRKATEYFGKAYSLRGASWCEAAYHLARVLEGKQSRRAKEFALEAAEAGHWGAMMYMVHYYADVVRNLPESIRWGKRCYEKAPEGEPCRGDLASHIAACYSQMEDGENCFLWAKKASEAGAADAMYEYAHLLYESADGPDKLREAKRWFRKFVEIREQDPDSAEKRCELGDAYNLWGMCCTRLEEFKESFPCFERAMKYGDPFGYLNLGGLYLGIADAGLENLDKALEYFLEAEKRGKEIFDDSSRGVVASQISVAYRRKEEWPQAFYWANQAASYQNEVGMIDLGMLYAKGLGTVKDTGKAIQWVTGAYNLQGPQAADAANYLGLLYEEWKDFKTASEWFRKSADLGNDWAMYNLATHYEAGDLSPDGSPNYKAALPWYEKARAMGGEAVSDAEEAISRCKAALGTPAEEEPAPASDDLKNLYMPWLSTMKWGSK